MLIMRGMIVTSSIPAELKLKCYGQSNGESFEQLKSLWRRLGGELSIVSHNEKYTVFGITCGYFCYRFES